MAKNEKGFCVFYDWVDDLDYLDPADAWVVVKAIKQYYQDGKNPVESAPKNLKAIVSMIFNQIKRSETISNARAEAGRNGAAAKSDSKNDVCQVLPKQNQANESKNDVCQVLPKQNQATETETETDNSFSQSAPARACEVYADECQQRKTQRGERWEHVVLSDDQFDDLCERLSICEFDHYMDVIEECEVSGKHYTSKTHYRAILEMAEEDRKTEKPPDRSIADDGGVSIHGVYMEEMSQEVSIA